MSLLEINQLFSKTIGAEATTLLASANPIFQVNQYANGVRDQCKFGTEKNNGERKKHTHTHIVVTVAAHTHPYPHLHTHAQSSDVQFT